MNQEVNRKVREYISKLNPGDRISVYYLSRNINAGRLTIIESLEWIYALGLEFPEEQEITRKVVTSKSGNRLREFYKTKRRE